MKYVGYWKGTATILASHPGFGGKLEDVHDFVAPVWDPVEKKLVLEYLARKNHNWYAEYGPATCRICGKENGSKTFNDGVYSWPEGYAHYVRDHSVRAPAAFVLHIKRSVS